MAAINATVLPAPSPTAIPISLMTFGLLSSCLHLPVLPDKLSALPLSADLAALGSVTSCGYGPIFMTPRYEPHLAAVRKFASQFTTLLSAVNPGAFNSTTLIAVPNNAPQTLPLWMGLSLFVLVLFQFVLMLVFVLSEVHVLFPNVAVSSKPQDDSKAEDTLKTPAMTRCALTLQRGLASLLLPATALLIALSIGVNTKLPTTTSATVAPILVLARAPPGGSNTSKLWLCVMAEAAICFISRRRIRRQVVLEEAKTAVWKQITASGFVLQSAVPASGAEAVKIDMPAPIYSRKPPTHVVPTSSPPNTGDDQCLSWRLVGDTSGKLYN